MHNCELPVLRRKKCRLRLAENDATYGIQSRLGVKLGLWLRLECSLDSLSIDSAHVIYVAEGHNVGAERQSSVMTLRKPIVTWII